MILNNYVDTPTHTPEAKTQKNELDTCLTILDPCLLKPMSIARHGSNYSENFF